MTRHLASIALVVAGASLAPVAAWSDAADGTWSQIVAPSARISPSMIYDSPNDRMVLFGGGYFGDNYFATGDGNDTWILQGDGTDGWRPLTPTGPLPPPRYDHTAIYDSVHARMIVFGGVNESGATFGDVWALSLTGAPVWTPITTAGPSPTARRAHSAVYDAPRQRMIVFGGRDAAGSFEDTWSLDLETLIWSNLATGGPSPGPSDGHAAIYDPLRQRMLMTGARQDGSPLWQLTLTGTPTWSLLSLPEITTANTFGPPSIYDPTTLAIYDPIRDRMVLLMGYAAFAYDLADTLMRNLLSTVGGPPLDMRLEGAAAYDPVRDRLVVFGGYYPDIQGIRYFPTTTWMLTLGGTPTWQLLPVAGPPFMQDHAAIYDDRYDRMIVLWGSRPRLVSFSTLPAITESTAELPAPRLGLSAVADTFTHRMIVFGGTTTSDVWSLSLDEVPVWTQLEPVGTPPEPRRGHTAIFDPLRRRMIVFGGSAPSSYLPIFNDVWSLSLTGTPTWTRIVASGTSPNAIDGHSAIYDPIGDRMIVFGGGSNDVWALSLSGPPAWTQLSPLGVAPSARSGNSAIWDPLRSRMVIFGGTFGYDDQLRDVHALSLSGAPAWTTLTPAGPLPAVRLNSRAIYDPARDRMVLSGGLISQFVTHYNTSAPLADLWALSWPSVDTRTVTANAGANGWLAPSGAVPVVTGASVTFTIIPEDCYAIAEVRVDGNSVGAVSSFTFADVQANHTIEASFALATPRVMTISDVRNDQGRQARITFVASEWDVSGSPTPVTQYEAYRRIDPLPSPGLVGIRPPLRDVRRNAPRIAPTSTADVLLAGWEFAGAIPAHGESEYTMIVPTLVDSNAANGPRNSAFFIRAATGEPTIFFDSCIDSGYTVDNLPPAAPSSFRADRSLGSTLLHWGANTESDFAAYRIYRGGAINFDPGQANLVATQADTGYAEPSIAGQGFYAISAVDRNGNESAYARFGSHDPIDPDLETPVALWLGASTPNPARDGATIRFGIPRAAFVRLTLHDAAGRVVRRLVNNYENAGTFSVRWNGQDDLGRSVPPAIYFYALEAGGTQRTRSLILTR